MLASLRLAVFCALLILPYVLSATCPSKTIYGVYDTGGMPNKAADQEPLRGRARGFMVNIDWDKVETSPDKYQWSVVDSAVKASHDVMGTNTLLQIYVGQKSPSWLYNAPFNVPKVTVESGTNYPYYLDETHITRFMKYQRALAARLASYPEPYKSSLISIQICLGSTGDLTPYRGTLKSSSQKYEISNARWDQYIMDMSKEVVPVYQNAGIPPNKLLFTIGPDQVPLGNFYTKELKGTSIKYPSIGHGHQINYEDTYASWLRPYAFTQFATGFTTSRAEFDGGAQNAGYFIDSPEWGLYYLFLTDLHYGLVIQNMPNEMIASQSLSSINFFNKYAGQHDPVCSPGAFIAFRDGLDTNDTKRFPLAQYGQIKTAARFNKIAAAFAKRGAKMGDVTAALGGALASRTPDAFNDVGYQIGDNYERFITQIDPMGTSIGWWQVGKKSQPYGRFARSFDFGVGKNTIYLDVNDKLFGTQTPTVNIRVVYYDGDANTGRSGSFSVQIMTPDGKNSYMRLGSSTIVSLTGSGLWKEVKGVTPVKFSNGLSRGSDIVLVNRGNTNVLFHMVEVTKS